MYPVPRHLVKIFKPDTDHCDEHSLDGKIVCDCGCKEFYIKVFAELDDEQIPHVCSYEDDWALVIKVLCKDCKKEWILFDMSKHGYNGYVCQDGVTVPDSELKGYSCSGCGNETFEIKVGIEVEDKEQFIEEVVECEPDQFSEEDYVDAFDWIVIDTKCPRCGREEKDWISFETA